jgi:uncharacterized protein (DUF302 family)
MKKYIIGLVIGVFIGAAVLGFTTYSLAPDMMMLEDQSKYNFEETVKNLKQAVKDHDWKIPKVHDLKKSMAKFGKKEILPVKVFELCHPDHAEKILSRGDERIVSSMMPCRVAVYQKPDGKVYVSRMNSGLMAGMMGGVVAEVMDQAAAENEAILSEILTQTTK